MMRLALVFASIGIVACSTGAIASWMAHRLDLLVVNLASGAANIGALKLNIAIRSAA